MAYRFKLNEPLSGGMKRVGMGQLELAARRLRDDPTTAVHEVRKSMKRIRALLRLMRAALGDKVFRTENARFRDLGRMLSSQRDLDVMRETMQRIEAEVPPETREGVHRLAASLSEHSAPQKAAADLRKVRQALAQAEKAFARLKLQCDEPSALEKGLHRNYKAGRRVLAQAMTEPSDEVFHDLRKAVQQHWRQMLLISNAWPEMFRARASAAREVAQLLGEEHDYAVLAAHAAGYQNGSVTADDIEAIVRTCRTRQQELRALALPKAQRLFAQSPKSFVHQFATSWAVACELKRQEPKSEQAPEQAVSDTPAYQG